MAPRTKKAAPKKSAPRRAAKNTSLPTSANIPEGMKQMGGGYAPTWTPKQEGESLHGIISKLPKDLTLNKGTRKENATRVLEITDMDGERHAVWDSAVLSTMLFEPIIEMGVEAIGEEVYITFDGLGEAKGRNNPLKLFTVYMTE